MRITKNVNVRETWYGFDIYNNTEVVASRSSLFAAVIKAVALAKTEGKGVRVTTDYYNTYINSAKVAKIG